ncbi:MAG TPA: NAD(+) diphosphatase [Candidatus Sulfotelmatobacter sp.]|nr:NAD(+) diphosphatase [Candidatus Sulfotelmatobacter sp.]
MEPFSPSLPFNRDSLQGAFVAAKGQAVPAERTGYWFLVQAQTLLVNEHEADQGLPKGPLPPPFEGKVGAVIFLGTYRGEGCWVAAVSPDVAVPAGYRKESLIPTQTRLTGDILSLSGAALQALHWERMSRRCPSCGEATGAIAGEWGRRCAKCGAEHYPSLHPCVIVLVRDGERVLLTRKSFWPKGRYGLVAGFVDPGESLEMAIRREVREEVGVEVTDLQYVASQYWPFPSQLMIGFTVRYAGGEVEVDHEELEDARWFSVHELPVLPPTQSIARYIIEKYGRP